MPVFRHCRDTGRVTTPAALSQDRGNCSQGRHGSLQTFARSCAMNSVRSQDRWTDGLMLNKHGDPLGNLRNVLHALRMRPSGKRCSLTTSSPARVITRRPPPWGDRTKEQWADDDDTRACVWFQDHEIPVTVGVVGRGIQTVARENPVHPVRDYLNALNWDRNATARHLAPHLPRRRG